jgi:hypothetical protein
VIKSIASIQFQARSGDDLTELLQRLVVVFDRTGKSRRSTIALLGSSSGRFKASVEAIRAEAITELAAARSSLPVVRVTAASLKKVLGCATGQKWRARAEERFNPTGRQKNWSQGAAGAAAAALKVAGAAATPGWDADCHREVEAPAGSRRTCSSTRASVSHSRPGRRARTTCRPLKAP